jgi:hypothetical protein
MEAIVVDTQTMQTIFEASILWKPSWWIPKPCKPFLKHQFY